MAIANRELDISEQKETFCSGSKLLTVGSSGSALPITHPVYLVPRPMTLVAAQFAAIGLSASPIATLLVHRNSAAGATVITGGMTALTLQDHGTSGPQAGVLAAVGSSFLKLAQGDLVTVSIGGDDVACFLDVALVLQSLQDIKSHF